MPSIHREVVRSLGAPSDGDESLLDAMRQMKKPESVDGHLMRYAICADSAELAHRLRVEKTVLHRCIGQSVPLLPEVNPQQHAQRSRPTPLASLRLTLGDKL